MQKRPIGKIEKPSADHFKASRRKLYLVPLLYSGKGLERDSLRNYTDKFKRYWKDAEARIDDLRRKLGEINRIYHELVDVGGKEGMEIIEKFSQESYQIIKKLLREKATLETTEDRDLVRENMDWSRCLAINPKSTRVLMRISKFYFESMQKRDEYIARRIDKTLKENEIGILFIRENNNVQFPSDIEVFRISSRVLDDIHQYLQGLPS